MSCGERANRSRRRERALGHRMYNSFRSICERLLRIPGDPGPPPGDESTTQVFRASPNYFRYLVVLCGAQTAAMAVPILVVAGVFIAVSSLLEKHRNGVPVVIGVSLFILLLVLLQRLFRLAILRLDYEKRWYVVTDRSLRVREGVVGVQEM